MNFNILFAVMMVLSSITEAAKDGKIEPLEAFNILNQILMAVGVRTDMRVIAGAMVLVKGIIEGAKDGQISQQEVLGIVSSTMNSLDIKLAEGGFKLDLPSIPVK